MTNFEGLDLTLVAYKNLYYRMLILSSVKTKKSYLTDFHLKKKNKRTYYVTKLNSSKAAIEAVFLKTDKTFLKHQQRIPVLVKLHLQGAQVCFKGLAYRFYGIYCLESPEKLFFQNNSQQVLLSGDNIKTEIINRSRKQTLEVFCKKGVLKIFENFKILKIRRKAPVLESLFNKVAACYVIKKGLQHRCFL